MVSRLDARGVAFDYPGPVRALAGVDVSVDTGELLAIIGPNGSGKSTLLRCLSGLSRPDSGEVRLDAQPLGDLDVRDRAREIAVVPQSLQSLPALRVRDFVLGGRYVHLKPLRGATRKDEDAVRQALEEADVLEVENRLLDEISGGQRQRVLIARALAQEARVLLVDEPTNALDPEHQLKVFELLAGLTCRGSAVVVVTHDLSLACQFATRILLLDEGRVCASGSVDEVMTPEVLGPVYGEHLHFGRCAGPDGRERPFVLPWLTRR